ncbi:hypothetical protein KR054_007144, partial [Drosophila jambulina]
KKFIKLASSQNEIFKVPQAIIKCSGILSIFCKDDDNEKEQEEQEQDEEEVVRLPNINSFILKKVIAWAMYHHEVKEITDWDADFINMDVWALYDLVAAADYLDIPELWSLGCKAMANLV